MSTVWWWFRRRSQLATAPPPSGGRDPLTISSLDPDTAAASGQVTVTIYGTGFSPTSRVTYIGVQIQTTTYVDEGTLIAGPFAVGPPATRQIAVVDGAETSNSLPFTVT